jgi:hypothetical protein
MVVAIGELVTAEIAVRRIRTEAARAAFDRAGAAASRAGIAALAAEIAVAREALAAPAARAIAAGEVRLVRLDEVEAILGSADLVVDGCRRIVRDARSSAGFASRPVLFAVVRALAEAWPGEVTREALVASAFAVRRVSDSQRARLRVEISRLRRELRAIAEIQATRLGFVLTPRQARRVIVLVPPIDGPGAAVRALLADGEAWSTSALAVALGQSQRTVQRALSELEARAQVQSRGGARARRWLTAPVTAVSTTLLLPALPIADDRDPDRD